MNVGIVVQARMKSSRLPGKVLRQVGDCTLLERHLRRLRAAEIPLYVATTFCRCDNAIAELAEQLGCRVFRGSKVNVLDRYFQVAQRFSLDVIVRTTADCPLIDGRLISQSLAQYRRAKDERLYLSPCHRRTFPRGLDFEIFSATLLSQARERGTRPIDLEHVTPYLYHPPRADVHMAHVVSEIDLHSWRLCVDTDQDLELIRRLIEDLRADELYGDQLLNLLLENGHLQNINSHVRQTALHSRG